MQVHAWSLMQIEAAPLPGQSAVVCMADARDQLAVIKDAANVTARLDLITPTGLARRSDCNAQVFGGQARGDAVGPLDEADALAFEVLVHTQVGKLSGRAQAIGVEMIDRQPRCILLDQDKGGTADRAAVADIES